MPNKCLHDSENNTKNIRRIRTKVLTACTIYIAYIVYLGRKMVLLTSDLPNVDDTERQRERIVSEHNPAFIILFVHTNINCRNH